MGPRLASTLLTLTSLNARESAIAEHDGDVPVALLTIDHEDMEEPLRISTDPTQRLSDDPLRYGTMHQGVAYYYALVAVPLPEQGQDAADTVPVTIDIVTPEMAAIPASVASPASVDIVQVMAGSPDTIEFAWLDPEVRSASVDTEQGVITLEVGRMPWLEEPVQRHRMTAQRFPGLHRR